MTCALRARAGKSLSELSEDVVKTTNDLIKWVRMNEAPDNPEPGKRYGRSIRNWALVKSIDPVQVAELVFACERIRMVCTRETIEKETSEGVFAMYGWSEGIYHELSLIHISEPTRPY